MQGANCELTL